MSGCLTDIDTIMDMNGFPLGNNFLCKDMGIMKVGRHCGLFLLVQFGTAWERLQPQGQENVHLCTNTNSQTSIWMATGHRSIPYFRLKHHRKKFPCSSTQELKLHH